MRSELFRVMGKKRFLRALLIISLVALLPLGMTAITSLADDGWPYASTPVWNMQGISGARPTFVQSWADNHAHVPGAFDGQVVNFWKDERNQATSGTNIYGQKADYQGHTYWGQNGSQVATEVDVNFGFDYYTVPDYEPEPHYGLGLLCVDRNINYPDVHVQKVDDSGNALWGPTGKRIRAGDYLKTDVQVAYAGSGNGIVGWVNENHNSLYFQKYDGNGNILWSSDKKVTSSGNLQSGYHLQSDASGNGYVGWIEEDNTTSPSTFTVYGQKLDGNGNRMWGPNGANLSGTNNIWKDDLFTFMDPSGNWYAFWTESPDVSAQIKGQRVDSGGNEKWGNNGKVMADNNNYDYRDPVAGPVVGQGWQHTDYIDVFYSGRNLSSGAERLLAMRVDAFGQPMGTMNVWSGPAPHEVNFKQMSPDGNNGSLVTWNTEDTANNKDTVYAQRLDGSFNTAWGDSGYQLAANQEAGTTWPTMASAWNNTGAFTWVQGGNVVSRWLGEPKGGFSNQYYFSEGTTRSGFQTFFTMGNFGQTNGIASSDFYFSGQSVSGPAKDVPAGTRQTVLANDYLDEGTDFATTIGIQSGSGANQNETPSVMTESSLYFVNDFGDGMKVSGGTDVVGAASLGKTWYFAEGTTRPGFMTFYTISNVGDSSSDVEVEFYRGDGTTEQTTVTVDPDSRGTINAQDVLGTGDDAAHDFSSMFTASGDVTVQRSMYTNRGDWNGGHGVMGATGQGTDFYFAEGTTRPGFDTFFLLSNTGAAAAEVDMTLARGDGTTYDHSLTVEANSRETVNASDLIGTGEDDAHDFATKISSTGPIQAERSMYWIRDFYELGGTNRGCHDVIGAVSPATTWYFAEGTTRPGFISYYTLTNFSAQQTTVTCTLLRGEGDPYEHQVALAPNSRETVNVNELLGTVESAASDFSAELSSNDNVAFVAERSMYFNRESLFPGWQQVTPDMPPSGGHATAGLSQ